MQMSSFEVVSGDDGLATAIKLGGHGQGGGGKSNEVSNTLLLRAFTTFTRPGTEVPIKYVYFVLGKLRAVLLDCERYNKTFEDDSDPVSVALCRAQFTETLSSLGLSVEKPVGLTDLHALIACIEQTYAEKIAAAKERIAQGNILYEDLAELYLPGTEVSGIAAGLTDGMGFIVRSCHYDEEKTLLGPKLNCQIEVEFMASVGDRFAVVRCQELLGFWQGLRPLSGLSYQQLRHDARARLSARGTQYAGMATGSHFLQCKKGMFYSGQICGTSDEGRVMVDLAAALDAGKKLAYGTDAASGVLEVVYALYSKASRQGRLKNIEKDAAVQRSEAVGLLVVDGMCFLDSVPPERFWNCWPMVLGYSFASKAWGQAMVEGLSPITWIDGAWDALVLPKDRKDLLQAVVKKQSDVGSIDVIKGKGEGTTFLLYGPPGTGKTLTAEAMAETLHRPLYIISAGEMGTTPEGLEAKFSEALRLCARWDCLCLVDEADTFLQQRHGSDVLRNALVCVMLRLLEYHPGVLFLTTNEAKGIDIAVQSRLTLAVRYEPLDFNARKQIWKNLLQKVNGCDGFDVQALAKAPLNGREIKNCVRLSWALSLETGQKLSQKLLASTVDTVCSFQNDLEVEQFRKPHNQKSNQHCSLCCTRGFQGTVSCYEEC